MAEEQQGERQPITQGNGTGESFDLERLDPNSLAPEVRPYYDNMLRDYRSKTENLANQRKDWETQRERYERELNEYREANQRWDQWYKNQDLDSFVQWQQTRQQQSGQPDYDPSEYMTRQEAAEYAQRVEDEVQQRLTTYQQQQTLLMGLNDQIRALGADNSFNPTVKRAQELGILDVNEVIKAAQQLRNPDLQQVAYYLYGTKVMEKEVELAKEAAYKQAREDAELEWKKHAADTQLSTGINRRIVQRQADSPPRGWGQATQAAYERWIANGGEI